MNSQAITSSCPCLPLLSPSYRGAGPRGLCVPLRDLWSSLARSSPDPLSHSWWGPRERPGTGSGHCMSSLDTESRQKSVSDERLEGNRGVESGAGYIWGFSYFGGSTCSIPTSPQSQSPQSDQLPSIQTHTHTQKRQRMWECFLSFPWLCLLSVLWGLQQGCL